MKIKRIKWWGYRGLKDGEIISDGADVEVRGQNGVGKSSIASIVPFVLFNEGSKLLRPYDEKGLNVINDGERHGAEVEFDNGYVFLRESGHKNAQFINGESQTATNYLSVVHGMIHGGGMLVMNPFEFCDEWSKDERRKFLVEKFGTFDEKEIIALPEFAEAEKIFNGMSVDVFENRAKGEYKRLKRVAQDIPGRIDELQRRLEDMPLDPKVRADLETELSALKIEREKISAEPIAAADELKEIQLGRERFLSQENLPQRIKNLQSDQARYSNELQRATREVDKLVDEYKKAASQKPKVCPTCKQPISKEQFDAWQKTELERIVADGRTKRSTQKELEERLLACEAELDTLTEKFAKYEPRIAEFDGRIKILKEQVEAEKNQRQEKRSELNEKISELVREIQNLDKAAEDLKRFEELRAQEKEINRRLLELERQLLFAKRFQIKKLELLQDQINANFEHVQFKMFDYKKTTGELAATCEAMLHGVPYSALSKGEKLKAALDIFRTMQKIYNIEMPLLLDDAESYTRNSFVDVPNQLWLFKVSDEPELVIEVKKEARLAA